MPALHLTGFGDPAEVVTLVCRPRLVAGRGEVVVALEAATVHPSDIHLIRGFYGVRPQLPAPLGAEGVGKVVEVGPGADRALLGRRVAILPTYEQGTWADQALVAARDVVAVSDEGDPQQLAMIGVNPITALLLLRLFGPLSEGEWIAQTGANSAVGQYVISFGALGGQPTALDVRQDLIYRNISHHGFWTFNWLTRAPRAEIDAAYQEIVALVTGGELTADIDSTFRLEQYADALSRAEHYRRRGKVLFVFGD